MFENGMFEFKHFIQQKGLSSSSSLSLLNSFSVKKLHFLWTQLLHWLQKIEGPITFLLQTEHGYGVGIRKQEKVSREKRKCICTITRKKIRYC